MSSLRQRREAETRQAIVDAALDLFRHRSYGEVTMEEVANRAGVSRRTLYRRYPTKDHVVVAVATGWLQVWDDAVASREPAESALSVAEAAAIAVATAIDRDATRIRRVFEIAQHAPWLGSALAANSEWTPRLIALLGDPMRGPGVDPAAAELIAGAYLGAIDAMLASWWPDVRGASVTMRTRALLDLLRPIWPGAAVPAAVTNPADAGLLGA